MQAVNFPDGTGLGQLVRNTIVAVQADDLLRKFSIRAPKYGDERLGFSIPIPDPIYPEWAE